MRYFRHYRLAGIIAICLSTTGCSMFYGFTCMVGIATSSDKTQPALQLPAASLAPYHETVSIAGSDWQHALHYTILPETVPPGMEARLLYQDESGHLTPPSYRSKPVREPQGKVWIEVSGTPQKAGKYSIRVKRVNYSGMCGSNDQIYPIVLKVVRPE